MLCSTRARWGPTLNVILKKGRETQATGNTVQVAFYEIGDSVRQVMVFFFLLKENEDVVEAALRRNCDRFTLEHCLPSWIHRGLPVFLGGRHITSLLCLWSRL